MRITTGSTDRYIYFVAVDATDMKTRETGLTTFTVWRSRNGAAAVAMTTPTINETNATYMPGVYELLLDEDTALAAGNDTEEMVFHITQASMAPVTRVVELYRPETTEGNTLDVTATGAAGIDWGNVENPTTAVDLSATDIQLCDTTATITNLPTGFAAATFPLTVASTTNISAGMITSVTDVSNVNGIASGVITSATLAASALSAIEDEVLDAALAGHAGAGTAGAALGEIGTAGAGLTEAGGTGDHLDDLGGMSTGMKAEVNTEVDTALSDYDAPTTAEMDSKFSTTDGLITTVDGVADGIATTLGTAGDGLTDLGGMSTGMKAEIAAQTWDATASSHVSAGTMGKVMNNMEAEHDDNTLMLQATIDTYSSNTEFIIDSGSTVNDTYLGCTIIIRDASDASVKAVGIISDYLGASKTITLSYDPNPLFTFAAGDSINIIAVPNKVSPATQTQLVASTWSENSVGYSLPGTFGNVIRNLGSNLNSLLLSTTIGTYTSQTSFTLAAGSSLNDAYVGSTIIITDHDDGEKAVGIVSDYVGATKTVTLDYNAATTWTFEADDIVNIIAVPSQLHSTIPTAIAQSVWASTVDAGSTGTGLKLYDIKEDTTSLLADTTTLKSRTPIHPVKNVALANFPFLMVSDVDHVSPVADLSSITAERAIDSGTFSAIAGGVSVIGNGMYRVDLSASDMNGNNITLRFSAAGVDDRLIILLTQPKE